jgi:hypothetical protein
MSTSLLKIEEGLAKLDLTRVVEFTKKIQDLSQGFNTQLAPIYLRDFIMAIDVTNALLAQAIRTDLRADAYCKQCEAIAFMDNAKAHLEARSLRDSAEARKKYVPMDPAVMDAAEAKAKTAAMVVFLKNKLLEFRLAHDDVKKMAYSNDYHHNTEYEGV